MMIARRRICIINGGPRCTIAPLREERLSQSTTARIAPRLSGVRKISLCRTAHSLSWGETQVGGQTGTVGSTPPDPTYPNYGFLEFPQHSGWPTGAGFMLSPPRLRCIFNGSALARSLAMVPGSRYACRGSGQLHAELFHHGAKIQAMAPPNLPHAMARVWRSWRFHLRFFLCFSTTVPSQFFPHLNSTVSPGDTLLDRIGPAILVTHSQAGLYGWGIPELRPALAKGILAVEPEGPPFVNEITGSGPASPDGISTLPLTYSPPVINPATDLRQVTVAPAAANLGAYIQQGAPVRKPVHLSRLPVLVVTMRRVIIPPMMIALLDICSRQE